ncbi:MAG TPA: hypothetical protein VEV13_00390 [Candidatus Limnocylindria bacterium]|nr:hypothetical protein [Candidatus Limnocylindria bacterium]
MSAIEEELRLFELQLDDVLVRVRTCVEQLSRVTSDDLRFLIAERLPALGSSVIPALQQILDDSRSEPSLRYLAAWVSIEVGDRGDGISVLCAEVEADTKWSLPAAGVLARHRIREGAGSVQVALARIDPRNTVDVMGYATALRDLGGQLPEAVRQRILEESPSWVAKAIEEDFPSE